MNTEEIDRIVRKTAHEVFGGATNPEIDTILKRPDFDFTAISGDSIDVTNFCFHVEDQLDTEIEPSDLFDNPTCSAFVTMLANRLA